MKKINYLKNERGSSIITYLMILTVTILIAKTIIPVFNDAIVKRNNEIISVFNSTDTIIVD